ncbi:hypothetical protein EYC58_05535 [Candidatus Saccharibacteria bacterium]|nr:MAG: hypothetical protein EYC58_05535 [Candidatus Saccharibacteria bacterium]
MSNAILIHGLASKGEYYDPKYPTGSNSHWFPWLSKQLIIRDIHTVALEMPNGYLPEYEVWKKELERFDIDQDTTLVGHSLGGGFLIRWLSEENVKVGKVVLVAPWLGAMVGDDRYSPEEFDMSFFDFEIDRDVASKTKGITVISSNDDGPGVQKTVTFIHEKFNGFKYVELENKGHFTLKSLGSVEFLELLEEIIS